MFVLDSSAPKGWNYVNLGMGNHLIVRDDMIALFMEQIGEDAEPSEVYMKWQRRYYQRIENELYVLLFW